MCPDTCRVRPDPKNTCPDSCVGPGSNKRLSGIVRCSTGFQKHMSGICFCLPGFQNTPVRFCFCQPGFQNTQPGQRSTELCPERPAVPGSALWSSVPPLRAGTFISINGLAKYMSSLSRIRANFNKTIVFHQPFVDLTNFQCYGSPTF